MLHGDTSSNNLFYVFNSLKLGVHDSYTRGVDPGVVILTPCKYVGGVSVCFDP